MADADTGVWQTIKRFEQLEGEAAELVPWFQSNDLRVYRQPVSSASILSKIIYLRV